MVYFKTKPYFQNLTFEWHHIALTYNSHPGSNRRCIYLDGANLGCDNGENLELTNEFFEIGGASSTREYEYMGYMMEVKVWDRAITQEQI